jgi:hypothetical protein
MLHYETNKNKCGFGGVEDACWPLANTYGQGFDSASNRNEYQAYFLGVKVAGA